MIHIDSFGEWLSRRRKSLGFTQEELAKQISCATITLRKIEGEQRRPSLQIAERLRLFLDIPAEDAKAFIRFARGDWQSTPPRITADEPWRGPVGSGGAQIPAPLTRLIGRDEEITRLKEYCLDPHIRLLTLVGPPGIGKSRLSIEIYRQLGSRFQDGVYFVTLSPLDYPDLIATNILASLGITAQTGQFPLSQLEQVIADKSMLIVLDDVEHLVENIAPLVFDLLETCLQLKIMITSRQALNIAGEQVFQVAPLSSPANSQLALQDVDQALLYPAIRLFAERASSHQPDFSITRDNLNDIVAICNHVDGLPLAIELLAAYINVMTPQTMLARLSDYFILHTFSMRHLTHHQKTLHHAIDWSYTQLTPREKFFFSKLAIFEDCFTLEAAEQTFAGTPFELEVVELLETLLEKNLLQRASEDCNEPRFYMFTVIRQFAAERLREYTGHPDIPQDQPAYFIMLPEETPGARARPM